MYNEQKLIICMLMLGQFNTAGGAELLSFKLVQSLAQKGHEVLVVCSSSTPSQSTARGIAVYPILRTGKIGLLMNFLSLYSLLRRTRCDVIHAHYVFPAGTLALVGKLLGIPVIVTSHGADIQKNKGINYGLRLNKLAAAIIWFTLKFIDCLAVVSQSMMRDAVDAGCLPTKIRVVYNGIDLKDVPLHPSMDVLSRNKITKKDFIVLYLGRLHPKKCPQDVVQAFRRVIQAVPNARLVFAGAGEEQTKLEILIEDLTLKDKVIFTGFVTGDDKWALLQNCGVFVLPAIVEAFGIAVIEAMACGKPAIATNLGPFPEIIKDGETGLLVRINSPDTLASAIIELALDEEKRGKMGIRAMEEVHIRFPIDKIADDYIKIYQGVARRRNLLKVRPWASKRSGKNVEF